MIARNIYLASRYSRKEEMREHAATLTAYGITVTSRWLKEDYAPGMDMRELTPEINRQIAADDLEDVADSDLVVFFCEDPNNQPPRGGRHFELGYALAQGVRIVCIGERENIFHYLPSFTHYESFEQYVEKELDI